MNLRKLRNASFDELRERAAQRVNAFSERHGWSNLAKLPTDQGLSSLMISTNGVKSEPAFFPGFESPAETAAAFKARWPNSAQGIIEKADRVCEGKFDLLGYTNLSFGDPIEWQFDPVSRKRVPLLHWSKLDYLDAEVAGDKKIIWELNRHQYFVTLGQAYLLTGDERYAKVFVNHLVSWMDAHPPKLGINWASSLEVAFRTISWIWAIHFFKESRVFTDETFKRVLKFFYLNARHLETYLSTYFSPNTHLTGEALGLFYLGTLFPDFKESERWRTTGLRILTDQVSTHVKPDGVYFEQTSYYHRYTTDFYLHLLILLRANGKVVPAKVEAALIALLDHLMYITRPDGSTPLFGDDDGGRLVTLDRRAPDDFRATLSTGAALFQRSDYKYVAGGAAEETLWLLGVNSLRELDLLESREPACQSFAFKDGGYYVMRDGWNASANYMRIDCGPHGTLNCGHAHADALSFDLAAQGRTILVDRGTYTYTGSREMRNWFRSSAAHNTLTIDGESSSVPDAPFSWKHIAHATPLEWISRAQFDFFSGKHDGYERLASPATHIRDILFIKGKYWIIRDRINTSGAHSYDLHFHFAPDARPSIDTPRRAVHESADNLPGLEIFAFGGEGQWRKEEGWISPVYGKRSTAPVCTFTVKDEGAQEFLTLMIPRAAAEEQARVSVEGKIFEIRDKHSRDVLVLGEGHFTEAGPIGSDFQLAWLRFGVESSSLEEVVLIGGRRLVVDGQEIVNTSEFMSDHYQSFVNHA